MYLIAVVTTIRVERDYGQGSDSTVALLNELPLWPS
jgi:hypothetical protein